MARRVIVINICFTVVILFALSSGARRRDGDGSPTLELLIEAHDQHKLLRAGRAIVITIRVGPGC